MSTETTPPKRSLRVSEEIHQLLHKAKGDLGHEIQNIISKAWGCYCVGKICVDQDEKPVWSTYKGHVIKHRLPSTDGRIIRIIIEKYLDMYEKAKGGQ